MLEQQAAEVDSSLWESLNRRRHNWDTVSQHLYGFFHRKWLGAIRDIAIAMPSTVKTNAAPSLLNEGSQISECSENLQNELEIVNNSPDSSQISFINDDLPR